MPYTTIDRLLNTSQGQRSLTGAANAVAGLDNGIEATYTRHTINQSSKRNISS